MKLLLETSLDDFFIALISNDKVISYTHIPELKKKADALPIEVEKILKYANIKTNDIDAFYITLGPGSFMGSRNALVYARTICQILKKDLYTVDTLHFMKTHIENPIIDARGGSFYKLVNNKPSIIDKGEPTIVDYKYILENIKDVLSVFQKQENILSIEPCYVKNPKIGGA